ncbi:MAG TPA: YlxR family protein [Dehalococcoidia bacterium]|nr:YlxR family protein [Dehalococcoidia bacterium]
MMRVNSKRLPQRTCIACRQVRAKDDLIRLVSTENGIVEIDLFGKKPGRGAYLCPQKDCWELALRKNRLDYALRTRLGDDNRQTLRDYVHDLRRARLG